MNVLCKSYIVDNLRLLSRKNKFSLIKQNQKSNLPETLVKKCTYINTCLKHKIKSFFFVVSGGRKTDEEHGQVPKALGKTSLLDFSVKKVKWDKIR